MNERPPPDRSEPPDEGAVPPGSAIPAPSPADRSPRGARVIEVLQTVLVGLMLAFIFRAFLVEPFIIPTGSMAGSLLGAHATQTCPACGWEFDFAPVRTATAGPSFVCPEEVVCPNCLLRIHPRPEATVPKAGDRLVVHKWPCAIGPLRPRRWDVVVFRDPKDAEQHYIKRLVGLPGETIEIVDGDLFIDGAIARKPRHVQRALWSIVFDQAHVPAPASGSDRAPRWIARTQDDAAPGWTGMDTRVISYDGLDDDRTRTLAFNRDAGRDYLQDFYAYNGSAAGHFVGDVRLLAEVTRSAGDGVLQLEIERPPDRFTAELHADGRLRLLYRHAHEDPVVLGECTASLPLGRPLGVEFAHVDGQVYLTLDGRDVLASREEDYSIDLQQARRTRRFEPLALRLHARNLQLELRGLRIERDVYYTDSAQTRRAIPGRPFELQADEYFVLGDNSPASHDSREWTSAGPHMPPDYRLGTVRGNQIVGQAAFVYLPGLLPVDRSGRWAVPDVGRSRFVR